MNIRDFLNSKTTLKLKELIHRFTYKKSYRNMAAALERYKNCKNKKPLYQIIREIFLCKKYWHCYPLHYYRYDLYKKEYQLSDKQLLNYIPEFFFYKVFLSYFDSDKYSILIEDKNITEQILRSFDIKQPNTLCKLIKGKIYTCELRLLNFQELMNDISKNQYEKIFVKPADGRGGHGFFIFHKNNDKKYKTKDEVEFNEKFLTDIGSKRDYIIQSGLKQDYELSLLYPDSVNTFRIATENIKGNVRIVCATLRIGKSGNEVDNSSQGGIALGIDINNGFCKDFATTTDSDRMFYKHPDTGFIFNNYKIKNWDEIKKFTIGCAAKLLQFTYLGWDIALTVDGPVVIEANLSFGLDHFQIRLGGLREAFHIESPDFYWNNRNVEH
jgi:hypothetical protein